MTKRGMFTILVPRKDIKWLRKWARQCSLSVEQYMVEVLEVWVQEKGVRDAKYDPERRCVLCPVSYAREADLRRRLARGKRHPAETHKLSILPAESDERREPSGK